jgi:hypothetical protein
LIAAIWLLLFLWDKLQLVVDWFLSIYETVYGYPIDVYDHILGIVGFLNDLPGKFLEMLEDRISKIPGVSLIPKIFAFVKF